MTDIFRRLRIMRRAVFAHFQVDAPSYTTNRRLRLKIKQQEKDIRLYQQWYVEEFNKGIERIKVINDLKEGRRLRHSIMMRQRGCMNAIWRGVSDD